MPLSAEPLRNTYYAFRHGKSVPNERGIIVSDPTEGAKFENGLIHQGEEQIRESIHAVMNRIVFPKNKTFILHSLFSRAMESARVMSKIIGAPMIGYEELRERFFGDYEGKSSNHYPDIWRMDQLDPAHTEHGIESVLSVLERMQSVVRRWEKTHENLTIILAGHGDPLQILETSFRGMDPSKHRELPQLENAEVRLLNPIVR